MERFVFLKIFNKVIRKFNKIRFAPIEVFVFHAVSDVYDPERNFRMDWMSTDDFCRTVRTMKEKYQFISLPEAHGKLKKDLLRRKRYAVLTCDDGFASALSILPFLEQERVPITLFINPICLEGNYFREDYKSHPEHLYITAEELRQLDSPWITIGMHGWEHNDVTKMTTREFSDSVEKCVKALAGHPRYIPFYAYTWGRFRAENQQVLKEREVVPVFCDGMGNYEFRNGISRKELLQF